MPMGRHTGEFEAVEGNSRSSFSVIAMMIILALVLLGFAIRGFSEVDSDEADAGTPSDQTSSAGATEADAAASILDMGEDDAEGTESATDPEAPTRAPEESTEDPSVTEETSDTSAPLALQECRSEVAAGDDWADATADSATHWKKHYSASVAYNDGDITLKEAEKDFAASKAKGADDVAAVASTKKAYEKAVGACDSKSADDLPDTFIEVAKACAARADAIGGVVPGGTEVNGDWSAHLEMMKTKDDTDPDTYYKRWKMMVEMAPDDMGPYDKAVKALDEAPTCPSA